MIIEHEGKISRRQFNKKLALFVTGSLLGLTADSPINNENNFRYSDAELIEKIKLINRKFNFNIGLYTYEESDWENFSKEVTGPKVWGTYYAIEELLEEKGETHDYINDFLSNIYNNKAAPLISLTTRWPYNAIHPFARENRELLLSLLGKVSERLNDFSFPINIRLYEMNLPYNQFNVFGANSYVNGKDHEDAFKEVFRFFSKTVKEKRKFETKVFFSPYVNSGFSFLYPFSNYFPGLDYCDAVGFDGYFYPNILGNPSPESVFEGPFDEILNLTHGAIPTWIFETGSAVPNHHEWLGHALLFAMSRPECGGFMHFGIDRTKEEGIDFTIGQETIKTYGKWSKDFIR